MDVQLNIRCSEETATQIKARAESAGMKLGAFLGKLIEAYQPDSATIANDSSVTADLRCAVADLNSRLNTLESRLLALEGQGVTSVVLLDDSALCAASETVDAPDSVTLSNDSTGELNQDIAAFKLAVVDCWDRGVQSYGAIAAELTMAGFRNSNGNAYTREAVKRTLKQAGKVLPAPGRSE